MVKITHSHRGLPLPRCILVHSHSISGNCYQKTFLFRTEASFPVQLSSFSRQERKCKDKILSVNTRNTSYFFLFFFEPRSKRSSSMGSLQTYSGYDCYLRRCSDLFIQWWHVRDCTTVVIIMTSDKN